MAHHASAIKRIRQSAVRRLRNRYQAKSTRTMIKNLKATHDKAQAEALYRKVASMVDKLAKNGVIHKKNASNRKSKLAKFVNGLS
jgi:small subunit ribosomal protein S20